MSDSPKAVFLSYASQDAEAAKRICDALRGAGVEVWFDQSELTGGDAWDQKIRKQIKECALFVPIISANTQARREGYFRLEWRLAVERMQQMDDDLPFLMPVVIDATRDAEAFVPERFRGVQWTRLPGGETNAVFCARMEALLGRSAVSPSTGSGQALTALKGPGRGQADRATARRALANRRWLAPVAVALTILISIALWSPWKKAELAVGVPPATAGQAKPAPPLTEAQQLVAKARTILDEGDDVNRETYTLAEELLKKAEALDVSEPSAWALHAFLSAMRYSYSLDRSAARADALRIQAERAIRLAPDSLDAQLASAHAQYGFGQFGPALESQLEALAKKYPNDWRVHRLRGRAYVRDGKPTEALAAVERALQLRPDDPALKGDHFNTLNSAGRFAEANDALVSALQGRVNARLLAFNVTNKLYWSGDVTGASSATQGWPAWFLLEDRGVGTAVIAALWNRDPGRAREVLQRFPRDYIRDYHFSGPRAVLSAWAHEQAGHTESARADWRIVRQVAERELATEPDNPEALHWRAWALGRLGETDAAVIILQQLEERNPVIPGLPQLAGGLGGLALVLGRTDDAIVQIARVRGIAAANLRPITKTVLRLNPLFDPLRGDPRFQALIEAAPGPEAKKEITPSPDSKSVAVLAFANLSTEKDNEYFSDGISEELLNVLAKIPGLKVSARTSAFHFKGKDTPIPEIARQLGVAYVVEGSVRKSGQQVRIAAQLIKAADGFHVWSETFARDLKDIFAVQDEIAGLIAKNLELKLGDGARAVRSVDPESYRLILQGRFLAQRENPAGWKQAIAYYRQAIAIEPGNALAWAQIARCHTLLARYGGMPAADAFREARAAAEKALTLDPDSALGHDAMGWVQRTADWNWDGAEKSFRRALALAPRDAGIVSDLAVLNLNRGRTEEAIPLGRTAIELDPLNAAAHCFLASFLWVAGRLDEAEATMQTAITLAPQAAEYESLLCRMQISQGKLEQAAASAERDSSEMARLFARALVQFARGERAGGEANLREFTRKFGDDFAAWVVGLHARAGQLDEAFKWLDRAMNQRETGIAWMRNWVDYEPLRQDPRWAGMLRRIHLDDPPSK